MVLIGKITDEAIVDNIKKRFNDDLIYVRLPFSLGDEVAPVRID